MPDEVQADDNQGDGGTHASAETEVPPSLKPTSANVTEPSSGEKADDARNHAPLPATSADVRQRLVNLNRRIKWLFVLNLVVACGAGLQAYFAFRSNQLTRETMITNQRAWITVKGATLQPVPKAGEYAIVMIEYVNTGQSPALGMVGTFDIKPSAGTPIGSGPTAADASRGVVGRDALVSSYVRSQELITAGDYARVLTNEMRLYMVGAITYQDIFGRQRETIYCFQSRGDGRQLNPGMDYCPDRNSAR